MRGMTATRTLWINGGRKQLKLTAEGGHCSCGLPGAGVPLKAVTVCVDPATRTCRLWRLCWNGLCCAVWAVELPEQHYPRDESEEHRVGTMWVTMDEAP